MNYNCLVIGYGVVGHNLWEELKKLNMDIVDKFKPDVTTKRDIKYDFGFICVDTPLKDGAVDTTEVINAINENDCDIYIMKSTCPVGTIDKIASETGKKIVFSPEYYGGTQHCNTLQ